MSVWAWVAIGIGAVLLVAATAALVVFAWRAYERRLLLRLVVRTEAVEAAAGALNETLTRLSEASDDELSAFADDPDAVERRVLHEVANRGNMVATELDHMPLPSRLIPLAEAVADAGVAVCEEAGRVGETAVGDESLEQLALMDLGRVRAYTKKARHMLSEVCEVCGLDETAIYGGGLYL